MVAKRYLSNGPLLPILPKRTRNGAFAVQTTLQRSFALTGVGLHSGRPIRMTVRPAAAGTGIVFVRSDVTPGTGRVAACWDAVIVSSLNTRIQNRDGISVSTIEHLMAAFAGTGLHNAEVTLSGPEVPVMDGSARPFVRAILDAGIAVLDAPLTVIEVLRPVTVEAGGARAALLPAATPGMEFTIDFADAAIGWQRLTLDLANGAFVRELSGARTFCRADDIEAMRAEGKALGGTLENAVVVDGDRVLSPGGFRHRDEAVRHKMLDAVGDLATAGSPILARYVGERAGHATTNALLRNLFSDGTAWRLRTCDAALARRLPGAGLVHEDLAAVA